MERKSITKKGLASKVHAQAPQYRVQDVEGMFEVLEDVITEYLDEGYKVKLGKLFTLEPQVKPPHKHYNGAGKINGGKATYVTLPKHIHIKVKKLQKIKDIESKHI